MANRNFHVDSSSLERGVVTLYAPVSIGAAGVSTLDKKLGIKRFERTATGTYEIELDDNYTGLIHVNAVIIGSIQDFSYQVGAEDVAGTKIISFVTKVAGAAADLADTTKVKVEIVLKNSSVKL